MEKKDTENLLYRNRFMALLFLCLPLLNKYCSFTLPPALNVTLQFLSQRKLKVPLTPPEKEKAKGLTNTSPYQPFFFFFFKSMSSKLVALRSFVPLCCSSQARQCGAVRTKTPRERC